MSATVSVSCNKKSEIFELTNLVRLLMDSRVVVRNRSIQSKIWFTTLEFIMSR
jgi:hypothetical protein